VLRQIAIAGVALVFGVVGYQMVLRPLSAENVPRAVPIIGLILIALALVAVADLIVRTLRALDEPGTSKPAVIARGLVGLVVSVAFLALLVGLVGHFMTSRSRINKINSSRQRLEQQEKLEQQTRDLDKSEKADATLRRLDADEEQLRAHPTAAAAAETRATTAP
jgi:hypothetical protein